MFPKFKFLIFIENQDVILYNKKYESQIALWNK